MKNLEIFTVQNFTTCENFAGRCKFSNFALVQNFCTSANFSYSTETPFCFDHNFFIPTPFWVILVSFEILESVESKYIQKDHF